MAVSISEQTLILGPYLSAFKDAVRHYQDDADPFHRGLIATRLISDSRDRPIVLLTAEIVAETLETLEIPVINEAQIAGCAIRRMRVHDGISDTEAWRKFALFPEATDYVADMPTSADVLKTYGYWKDKSVSHHHPNNSVRQKHGWIGKYGIASPYGFAGGHTLPDHGIILEHGIDALRSTLIESISSATDIAATTQFRAMERCLEGLSRHIERCAEAAAEQSAQMDDGVLSDRLNGVAERCRNVAHHAPDTFAEALQLIYFSNFADRIGNSGDASSYGRIDQLLYPFYNADIVSGATTAEEAYEMVCHFMIKIWGDQESRNLTIGGLRPDGTDGTNDVSHMIVRAMDATDMVCDLSVRVHDGTPEEFLDIVATVIRRHFGRPDVYNDEVTIPALTAVGVELEDARDYAPLGCVEVMIPGRSPGRTMGMGLNHVKVLESVLNDGKCLVTGDQVFTDIPDQYESYAQLEDAFFLKIQEIIDIGAEIIKEDESIEVQVKPKPWLTVLSRGGLTDGRDLTAGQPKYDLVGVTMDGVADVANSLRAVQRLVFDEQRLSLQQLRDILANNWTGQDLLRAEVINTFERFGQDADAVDQIAARLTTDFADHFLHKVTAFGGRFMPMIFGVTSGLLAGKGPKTGACASGRLAGQITAQSLQPSPAGPQGTPTEILRSAAVMDFTKFPGGISNVQNFDPSLVQGDSGITMIKQLIRGYFSIGGMELAMNFISAESLREAQKHPENFPYLMVRLFGMSARFVLLSPALQEDVIQKVEAASRRST